MIVDKDEAHPWQFQNHYLAFLSICYMQSQAVLKAVISPVRKMEFIAVKTLITEQLTWKYPLQAEENTHNLFTPHPESKVLFMLGFSFLKTNKEIAEFSQWHLILSSGWFQHLLGSLVLMGLKWHIYFWQHIWIYITWCIISIMYPSSLNTSSNSLRISSPFYSGDMLYIHLTISSLPFNLSKHETSFPNISHTTEWYRFLYKYAIRILLVVSFGTSCMK